MIYEVRSHNGDRSYLCEESGGGANRGYADTFEEIVLGADVKHQDICATVSKSSRDSTEAQFSIIEKDDGIYINFHNSGKRRGSVGEYEYSAGNFKVEFD